MHQIFDGLQVQGPTSVQGFLRDPRTLIYGAQVTWGSAYDWGSAGPPDLSNDAPNSRTVVRGHVVAQGRVVCHARRGKGASAVRAPYGAAAVVYYLRPGGDDANDGLSATSAFATFKRLLAAMAGTYVNRPVGGDITGMTVSAQELLNLGGDCQGGVMIDAYDYLSAQVPYIRYRHSRFLWADAQLVRGVTVTNQAVGSKSGLLTLTVSDTLVANAHRGQFVATTTPGEYAEIRDNTTSTITVNWAGTLTAPVSIYATGAELRFGNQSESREQAIYLTSHCDWGFTGIKFSSNGSAKACAITVWPVSPVSFQMCDIAGIQLHEGGGDVTLDSCYVHDKTFSHDGASLIVYESGFRSVSFICHGSGASGVNEWSAWSADLCSAIGAGNLESRYTFQFANFEVAGGTGHGVRAAFGTSSMLNGLVKDCVLSAVYVDPLVSLFMTTISGKGTTGRYGIEVPAGPGRITLSGCDVSGALNDILHGATAEAYAAVPIADAAEYIRIV